jgi:ABC-type transport system substrate-binding protein
MTQEDNVELSIATKQRVWSEQIIYEKLTGVQPDKKYSRLAESWTHSDDWKTWTFNLRKNATWSDGTPLTSEDVLWNYELSMVPEMGVYYGSLLSDILESMDAPDEHTFVIHLKEPCNLVEQTMITDALFIAYPKHVLGNESYGFLRTYYEKGENLITTGPYIITEWKEGEYERLDANSYWWGGRPFVDTIYLIQIPDESSAIAALETGEVDVITDEYDIAADLERLEGAGYKVETDIATASHFLIFNLKHPILSNKLVRWAMNYMVPREHIVEDIFKGVGKPGAGQIGSWCIYYDQNIPIPEYNIEKAKECMEEAGYKFEYITPTPPPTLVEKMMPILIGLICGIAIGIIITYIVLKRG